MTNTGMVQYRDENGDWVDLNKPPTDLERFVELYKSFGIECKPESCMEGVCIRLETSNRDNGTKITGDAGILIDTWFTHSGGFLEQQVFSSY